MTTTTMPTSWREVLELRSGQTLTEKFVAFIERLDVTREQRVIAFIDQWRSPGGSARMLHTLGRDCVVRLLRGTGHFYAVERRLDGLLGSGVWDADGRLHVLARRPVFRPPSGERVLLFRGVGRDEDPKQGISWSTDPFRARDYARGAAVGHAREGGRVYRAVVPARAQLGVLNDWELSPGRTGRPFDSKSFVEVLVSGRCRFDVEEVEP